MLSIMLCLNDIQQYDLVNLIQMLDGMAAAGTLCGLQLLEFFLVEQYRCCCLRICSISSLLTARGDVLSTEYSPFAHVQVKYVYQ